MSINLVRGTTATNPDPQATTARVALARLRRHVEQAAVRCAHAAAAQLATDLLFASLQLEDVEPPYLPLSEQTEPSTDPAADLATAIEALLRASARSCSPLDTLRYAFVIRDLRAIRDHAGYVDVLRPLRRHGDAA